MPADATTQASLPILIVDDDPPTQGLLQVVLRKTGHPSEIATNGRDAIALLQTRPYAAVVLDLMMPEVDGWEVVAHLRASEKPVPVIVCSAAGPAAFTGFDSSVVKAIIRKPFDIEQLLAVVSAVALSRD